MISYAQNGEDVVLQRVFADRTAPGFYVDVGACHPVEDSVTLHFYQKGWHGVNIEPDADLHAVLAQARPNDVNLHAAVGRRRGREDFYPTDVRGHGTLDALEAEREGSFAASTKVPVMMLADVLDMYGPDDGQIAFLKIDVEGWENHVLDSADWTRHRPQVILVESVDREGHPLHQAWEADLLAGGYVFALFDGLNRFYTRQEDAGLLLPRLTAPANVLDHWRRNAEVMAEAKADRLAAEKAELARTTAARLSDIETRTDAKIAELTARAAHSELLEIENKALLQRAESAETRERDRSLDLRERVERAEAHGQTLIVELARTRAATAAALRREEAAEELLADIEAKAFSWSDMSRIESAAVLHVEQQLAALQGKLDEFQSRHREETLRLQAENAKLAAQLDAMRVSSSWRLTRPFRFMIRSLKRLNFFGSYRVSG
jgi:FkbM family methyltransferase